MTAEVFFGSTSGIPLPKKKERGGTRPPCFMPARVKKHAKTQEGSSPAAKKAVVKKEKPLNPHRWHGGVVGGALRLVAASDLCWHVKFFGVATQKFATEREAKRWRRRMSGALDRTANMWRIHPSLSNTIEMQLGNGKSVLYDDSQHDTLVEFRWHFSMPSRVFTRGKLVVGRLGVNRRAKKQRPGAQGQTWKQLSMQAMLKRKRYHREREQDDDNVIDNRLANLVNDAAEARTRPAEVS